MAKVTSPPHDVITPDERDAYIEADGHNVCQIMLPPGGDERYAQAKQRLDAWLADGTLARDERPAFYVYEVRRPGHPVMRGFFSRIAIDPSYTHIKRHEMTLPKKRSDRLRLLEETGVNTESIWMLYRDERGWVDEVLSSNAMEELHRFTDENGVEHRVWRVDRPEAVAEVQAQFEDRDVVIADGHHRYATQLKHHAATGAEGDASLLVCLVRDTDAGLDILPTNRLLRTFPFASLEAGVDVDGWAASRLEVPDGDDEAVGAFLRQHVRDAQTVVALSADGAWMMRFEGPLDQGRGRLDRLAVTTLHDHLLCKHWGVDMDHVEEHLHYSRSDAETVARIRRGDYPVAVMLAGEPVDAVLDVANDGHVMPQKATYFVPKLRSGLVMGPCDEPMPRAMDDGLEPGPADFRMPKL